MLHGVSADLCAKPLAEQQEGGVERWGRQAAQGGKERTKLQALPCFGGVPRSLGIVNSNTAFQVLGRPTREGRRRKRISQLDL